MFHRVNVWKQRKHHGGQPSSPHSTRTIVVFLRPTTGPRCTRSALLLSIGTSGCSTNTVKPVQWSPRLSSTRRVAGCTCGSASSASPWAARAVTARNARRRASAKAGWLLPHRQTGVVQGVQLADALHPRQRPTLLLGPGFVPPRQSQTPHVRAPTERQHNQALFDLIDRLVGLVAIDHHDPVCVRSQMLFWCLVSTAGRQHEHHHFYAPRGKPTDTNDSLLCPRSWQRPASVSRRHATSCLLPAAAPRRHRKSRFKQRHQSLQAIGQGAQRQIQSMTAEVVEQPIGRSR